MAISQNQFTITTSTVTTGTALTTTASVGNLSVVALFLNGAGAVTSITDNKSNTYVRAGLQGTVSGNGAEIWYAANAVTGITSVTANFTSSTAAFAVYDCVGAAAQPLGDVYELSSQTATTNPQGPVVLYPNGGGIEIALLVTFGGTVNSIASPFVLDDNHLGAIGFAHNLNSAGGSFTANWTTTSATWAGVVVLFKSGPEKAILNVQLGNHGFSTTSSVVVPVTAAQSGNMMTVSIEYDGSVSIQSVTDNAAGGSNNYIDVLDSVASGALWKASLYYATVVNSGATSITVQLTGTPTSFLGAFVEEWSGLDVTQPDDQNAGNSGTSTSPNSGSIGTTSQNYELLYGFIVPNTGTVAASTGWRMATNPGGGNQDQTFWQIVITTGQYMMSGTMTNNTVWTAQIATFQQTLASTQGYGAVISADYQWLGGDDN